MRAACLATTFPSPLPPEPPLTFIEWAGVAWFSVPAVLVAAIALLIYRRRRASTTLTWMLNVTAALSMAVFIGMTVLVAIGYDGALHSCTWPVKPVARSRLAASLQNGRLYVGVLTPTTGASGTARLRSGFGYLSVSAHTDVSGHLVRVGTMRQVVAPTWAVISLSAIIPGAWFARRIRSRQTRRLGLCARCGYDLRGSPTRCPECGQSALLS